MALEIATTDSQDYKFNPLNFGALHFSVKASNDAHIALTATPENKPPKYEVFLGGWGNTKSSIRKNNEEPDKVIIDTPKILNGDEVRGFWIKWGGGFIGVGKQGEEKPFMSWQDDESLNVSFFGVRTGWGATGAWTIEENIYINTDGSKEYIFKVMLHGSISFSIDSANDAHIALTTKAKDSDPMIEILLGGWKNTASAIRYNKQSPDKVHIETPQLLCKDTAKTFFIIWRDGVIEVFSDNSKLFEWKNPNPFNISYFGVRTCWGAIGNWRIHGVADEQFKNKIVSTPKPKPGKEKAPPAASPGWNVGGPTSGPVQWVHASNGEIPPNALVGGRDATNEQLYIARAEHNGALIPGKLVPSHGVTYVAWGGVENPKENYEVLCNCTGTWVKANNGEIPVGALSSGHTENGEPLFVGRGDVDGSLTVGKARQNNTHLKKQTKIMDTNSLNIHNGDNSYIDTLIMKLLKSSLEKENDDHDVFGAYVAMEMRNLTSDIQKKLRTEIRDAITRAVIEESVNKIEHKGDISLNEKHNLKALHEVSIFNSEDSSKNNVELDDVLRGVLEKEHSWELIN